MNIDHHYSFWQRWYRCIVCQKHTIHLSFCLLQIIQVIHILGTNISIRIRIVFFFQIMILLILHCHLLQFTLLTSAYINVMSLYIFLERILLCFLGKNIQIQILEDANCIFSQSKRVLAIHFFFKAYRAIDVSFSYHFPLGKTIQIK